MNQELNQPIAMDPNTPVAGSAKAGTIGGTFLIFIMNVSREEIVKTATLAAIGAVVSFSVSIIMKVMIKKVRRK